MTHTCLDCRYALSFCECPPSPPTAKVEMKPVAYVVSGPSDTLLVWADPEQKIRELLSYHVNDTRDDYTVTPLVAA